MLSGYITLRGRKFPLTWTGQFAQHVATNFIENNNDHPFLHMIIQQRAAKGKLYKDGGRYLSVYIHYGTAVTIVVLSLQSKAAIIHTGFVTNQINFENKKRKSVSGTASKKLKPSDFEISPETIAVSENNGVSENSLRTVLAKFFNGEKPLNKKR